ncbi:MATE family efflux transporter [Candidatus Gracilibacteria bacterium]|nr:MAG: MATE family efflux transporter [Candidatus Gracilibacteria bacterium]
MQVYFNKNKINKIFCNTNFSTIIKTFVNNFIKMKNKNLNISLEGNILKGLFFLSLPILIGNFLQASYNFVDAYWIGKISKEAVASISASFPIIFFIVSLGTGFSMAGTILIAQYAGAKNKEKLDKTASQTLTIDVFLAVFLGMIGYFSSESILKLLKVNDNVIIHALPYLKITFIGLVFSFIFSMFQSIMRGVGEVKLPMYIILATVILNFIIDPILILGFGPIPAMGVSGAAIATIIAQFISAGVGVYILFKGNHSVKVDFKNLIPKFSFIKKVFFLGLPSSIEMSIRSLGMVLLTGIVTYFGTVALAGFGAGGNIFQFIFIPTMGFSIAISTMVGQNIGAGNIKRASQIAKTGTLITFVALEIIGLFIFIFAPFLIELFVNDRETIKTGVDLMRISAFSFGIMGIQFALTGVFRAAGNTSLAMILGIVSMFVVQLPIAFILSIHLNWGINGVWWSFTIVNIIMAIICVLIYLKGNWKNKKITAEEKKEIEIDKSVSTFKK